MVKSLKIKKVALDGKKSATMAFRLDLSTAATFRRLAEKEGVGTSTFARAVIEQYVKDYGSTTRKVKKKKRT